MANVHTFGDYEEQFNEPPPQQNRGISAQGGQAGGPGFLSQMTQPRKAPRQENFWDFLKLFHDLAASHLLQRLQLKKFKSYEKN